MIKRMFLAAIAAGLLAGLLITAVQTFTTTPIILHAEQFEAAGDGKEHKHGALVPSAALVGGTSASTGGLVQLADAGHGGKPGHTHQHADGGHGGKPGHTHQHAQGHLAKKGGEAPALGGGLERLFYTGLANLLMGVGFGLLLVACFALYGKPVDPRRGVLWGLAGFAVFTLAPGLGLPPEVPGSKAAAVTDRQIWWAFAAVAAALGLWLMVFARQHALKVLGVVVIAVPHLIGAPQPAQIGGAVPPELAGHFAAASIVVSAIFWASLGWLSGTFWQRLGPATAE
ncbi:MAG TPA: CbtA family protein [Alphaproteobacteria bacterium]|jgi:cobalt transporter subunit CbtA|nr:CbtA family protein [Alphaproteobacteria bacterium]